MPKLCLPAEDLSIIRTNVSCPIGGCDRVLPHNGMLAMHLKSTHGVIDKGDKIKANQSSQYHCPISTCVYNIESEHFFTSAANLKQHYLRVHAEKTFKCAKCPKAFSTSAQLRRHSVHCGAGTVFRCLVCECPYTTPEAMITHCSRKNHGPPPPGCLSTKKKSSANGRSSTPMSTPPNIFIFNIMPQVSDTPSTQIPFTQPSTRVPQASCASTWVDNGRNNFDDVHSQNVVTSLETGSAPEDSLRFQPNRDIPSTSSNSLPQFKAYQTILPKPQSTQVKNSEFSLQTLPTRITVKQNGNICQKPVVITLSPSSDSSGDKTDKSVKAIDGHEKFLPKEKQSVVDNDKSTRLTRKGITLTEQANQNNGPKCDISNTVNDMLDMCDTATQTINKTIQNALMTDVATNTTLNGVNLYFDDDLFNLLDNMVDNENDFTSFSSRIVVNNETQTLANLRHPFHTTEQVCEKIPHNTSQKASEHLVSNSIIFSNSSLTMLDQCCQTPFVIDSHISETNEQLSQTLSNDLCVLQSETIEQFSQTTNTDLCDIFQSDTVEKFSQTVADCQGFEFEMFDQICQTNPMQIDLSYKTTEQFVQTVTNEPLLKSITSEQFSQTSDLFPDISFPTETSDQYSQTASRITSNSQEQFSQTCLQTKELSNSSDQTSFPCFETDNLQFQCEMTDQFSQTPAKAHNDEYLLSKNGDLFPSETCSQFSQTLPVFADLTSMTDQFSQTPSLNVLLSSIHCQTPMLHKLSSGQSKPTQTSETSWESVATQCKSHIETQTFIWDSIFNDTETQTPCWDAEDIWPTLDEPLSDGD